jgi:hypothetical protein
MRCLALSALLVLLGASAVNCRQLKFASLFDNRGDGLQMQAAVSLAVDAANAVVPPLFASDVLVLEAQDTNGSTITATLLALADVQVCCHKLFPC